MLVNSLGKMLVMVALVKSFTNYQLGNLMKSKGYALVMVALVNRLPTEKPFKINGLVIGKALSYFVRGWASYQRPTTLLKNGVMK